ncbi:hypothetical protein F5888DRAFT_1587923, partial [Russula emetica]
IREKCCCPTFLIAAGGPWLSVLGSVFTDKIIVQHLTEFRWMAISSTEEDIRFYNNAKIFIALCKCLEKLRTFYETLDAPPFLPNQLHPCYFPYTTSFTNGNSPTTHFQYVRCLKDNPASVTYLAEIPSQDSTMATRVQVVVKFVTSYRKEVHEFLAEEGCAPKLRYYGPLPGRD